MVTVFLFYDWSQIRSLLSKSIFTLIPDLFGTVTERNFWKNSKTLLVASQLGLGKFKLYVQIECQLGYIMNHNLWCSFQMAYAAYYIPVWGEICRAEKKDTPCLDGCRAKSLEKFIAQKYIYKLIQCCPMGYFSQKRARWRSRVLKFSRIRR